MREELRRQREAQEERFPKPLKLREEEAAKRRAELERQKDELRAIEEDLLGVERISHTRRKRGFEKRSYRAKRHKRKRPNALRRRRK